MAAVVRADGRGRERCHGAGEGRLALAELQVAPPLDEVVDKWEADEAKGLLAPLGLV
jgi:hypothetical protein